MLQGTKIQLILEGKMSELPINKKMRVIKLYLQGCSYDDIVNKAGVSKGTVYNVTSDLKEGLFPEISTIPEEIEQLRELATDIKRNNISPVKASIGLSTLERLTAMGMEPATIEKCHTLLQALSTSESDLAAMARSIFAIEEVKQKTGMTLEELEAKVALLRKEAEELAPISEKVEARKKELIQLERDRNTFMVKNKELSDHETALSSSVNTIEVREVQLRSHVAELEERARAADKRLVDARRDLKSLDKIGMSIDELNRFTVKLKEIAAHHDIKPEELYSRLFKELRMLDKGLNLEYKVKETEAQLGKVRNEITKGQTEKESLHAYLKQLTVDKANLETRLAHYRKQLANDITILSEASKRAIGEISDSLKLSIQVSLSEVNKLSEEALRVGKDVGKLEASIESSAWVKPLISMVRGENGLDDYQVRIIGLTILRSMSLWLNEKHGQDFNLGSLKTYISYAISELEKWKSSTN
jgi:chromosome segregation ATPase